VVWMLAPRARWGPAAEFLNDSERDNLYAAHA
jgi:hypothetical protein